MRGYHVALFTFLARKGTYQRGFPVRYWQRAMPLVRKIFLGHLSHLSRYLFFGTWHTYLHQIGLIHGGPASSQIDGLGVDGELVVIHGCLLLSKRSFEVMRRGRSEQGRQTQTGDIASVRKSKGIFCDVILSPSPNLMVLGGSFASQTTVISNLHASFDIKSIWFYKYTTTNNLHSIRTFQGRVGPFLPLRRTVP